MENIISFDNMLDTVSKLPVEEQLMLAEIIKKRIIEQRRKELAGSIKESMEEYNSGKAKTGSLDDLIRLRPDKAGLQRTSLPTELVAQVSS